MSDWFTRNRHLYPENWDAIAGRIKTLAHWRCAACDIPHGASPHVLTVHHVDHTPANCDDANLVALCQRHHLRAHGRRYRDLTKAELIAELRRLHETEIGQLCLPLTNG